MKETMHTVGRVSSLLLPALAFTVATVWRFDSSVLLLPVLALAATIALVLFSRWRSLRPAAMNIGSAGSSQANQSTSPPRTPVSRRRRSIPSDAPPTDPGSRRRAPAPRAERPELAAHRRLAEGRAHPDDVVPRVVLEQPDVDWRPRVALPFELSLFHSLIDALEYTSQPAWRARLFVRWRWWSWLAADPARAHAFVGALTEELQGAPEPARSDCLSRLDRWLSDGVMDQFRQLRTTLKGYRALSLAEIHRREADAAEYKFGEEWLLYRLLRTMVLTMVHAGVLRMKPPHHYCAVCHREFVEGNRRGGEVQRVRLVCFLPCSHWMVGECFEEYRATGPGEYDYCPTCREPRLALMQEFTGHVV